MRTFFDLVSLMCFAAGGLLPPLTCGFTVGRAGLEPATGGL